MGAPLGHPKAGGRAKGTPNKFSLGAKEAFQFAFDKIGGAEKLGEWANRNTTEFYKLYGRLIPTDVKIDPDANKIIVEIRDPRTTSKG